MASIRRRKGRPGWPVDYFDAAGRRRRLAAPTREAAKMLRAQKVAESRQAAPPTEDAQITMTVYAERWLRQITGALAPRTVDNYRTTLRLYALPAFGPMTLRAIHHGHIKALLAQKRNDGLSKNSVRLIRAALSAMLGDAVEDGILLTNPALGIGRRGRGGSTRSPRPSGSG